MSDGGPDPPQPRPRKPVSRARQRWSVMVLAGAAESLSSAKQEKLQVTDIGLYPSIIFLMANHPNEMTW